MTDSNEVRFTKVEMNLHAIGTNLDKLEDRVEFLEDDHTKQVNILMKLGQTVEILLDTVSALSDLTKELDKGQEVFKARFNIIIGILGIIGASVLTGVVKILFFSGVVH